MNKNYREDMKDDIKEKKKACSHSVVRLKLIVEFVGAKLGNVGGIGM